MEVYVGIKYNRFEDFKREKDDTPRTMYTRLARFARESRGVFVES